MSIPIGETEIGAWYHITDEWAHFVRENTWSYDYAVRKVARIGTYEDFKKEYPYDNGTTRCRSKVLTKYNSIYNHERNTKKH